MHSRNANPDPYIQIQSQSQQQEEPNNVHQTFGLGAPIDGTQEVHLTTMKEAMEEAEDTMMDGQGLAVRDDLDDEDEDEELLQG